MSVTDAVTENGAGGPPADDPAGQGWRQDKQNRWFIPARGRSGVIYRQGNETLDEAYTRDAKGPKDRRPKPKAAPKKPPAPTQTSLKELEHALTQALMSPAMAAAMTEDSEWVVNHFMVQGPVLARNLVKAAEHNPWLREKLEAAMTGEVFMVKLITTLGLVGAVGSYAIPPMLYYLRPKFVPQQAMEIFGVPDRPPKKKTPDAAAPAPAPPPAPAAAETAAA